MNGNAVGHIFEISVVGSAEMLFISGFQQNHFTVKKQAELVQLKFECEPLVLLQRNAHHRRRS